jgi:pilus assembly protein Flp/PilA
VRSSLALRSAAQPLPVEVASRGQPSTRDRNFAHPVCWRVETPREEDVMELVNRMRAFVREDSGQDLLEYALLVGLIALVCVLAVTNAGTAINGIFSAIAGSLAGLA